MGLPVTVLIEVLLCGAVLAVAWLCICAVANKVRDWDRASVGLVAGTHLRWSEETAQKIRGDLNQGSGSRVELDIAPGVSDFQIHMTRAADALTQLQKTMLGFREPIEILHKTLQGVALIYMRPGISFTHTYNGAGRYKFTYTEGTIND